MGLKVANLTLKLAAGVLLARVLGSRGFGTYTFALALVGLLQIPTQMGLPGMVTREVAAYRETGQWAQIRGLLSRANQGVALLGVGTAGMAAIVGLAVMNGSNTARLPAFLVALTVLPIGAISSLRLAALRGLRHVLAGQVPELLVQPGVLVVALGGWYFTSGPGSLSAPGAVALNAVAASSAFLVGTWWLFRKIPDEVRNCEAIYNTRQWLVQALPFLALSGLYVASDRISIVILGVFRPDEEVGIYQVCLTLSSLVAFGLQAASITIAPNIARLWVRKDAVSIQKLATAAAWLGLTVAVPVAALLVGLGGPLLAVVFGEEFAGGRVALALLALGQVLNCTFGALGVILNMTGHTTLAVRGFVVSSAANVTLNLVLVPIFGMEGAAVAAAISFAVWNGILFVEVRARVGVVSLPFGRHRATAEDGSRDSPGPGHDETKGRPPDTSDSPCSDS